MTESLSNGACQLALGRNGSDTPARGLCQRGIPGVNCAVHTEDAGGGRIQF